MEVVVLILCLAIFVYCIGNRIHNGAFHADYKAGSILMLDNQTASDKLDEIELLDVSMKLRPDEACYFEGEGVSYHSREVVSGHKRTSYGSSTRIMRGYSVHRSNGQSEVLRKTVNTEYPGRLFITNERIVFLAERYGFDIGFDKLSNITMYNECVEVFAGSKFYRVFTPHTVFIRDLITLMNMCHEDQYVKDDCQA